MLWFLYVSFLDTKACQNDKVIIKLEKTGSSLSSEFHE